MQKINEKSRAGINGYFYIENPLLWECHYHKLLCEKNDISTALGENAPHTLISDSFGVVKSCSLRGEVRRDLEGGLRYGVKMNHMITFDFREFSFLTYIIPPS